MSENWPGRARPPGAPASYLDAKAARPAVAPCLHKAALNPQPRSNVHVNFYPSPGELAQAAAEAWLLELQAAQESPAPYAVALSGGRIARTFCEAIVSKALRNPPQWHTVHFFWSDERCLPPRHPESNFGLAEQSFFQPLHVPAAQIHRIRGEDPPAQAARAADADLRRLVPTNPAGVPVLDLVLLGMGEDGHIASLFPTYDPVVAFVRKPQFSGIRTNAATGGECYQPVTAPKPPAQRITLTYPVIIAAAKVWVLASGPGKERALQDSLSQAGNTPLARILRARAQTTIFTDILPPH